MIIETDRKKAEQLWSLVTQTMENLDLKWTLEEKTTRGLAFARDNVWSRSARRKREREKQSPHHALDMHDDEDDLQETAALGVAIAVEDSMVIIRWLKGTDHVLYESFSGMLKRAVTT